jgi:hypothetical protein
MFNFEKLNPLVDQMGSQMNQEHPDWDALNKTSYEMCEVLGVKLPYHDTESFVEWMESGEPLIL